MFLFGNDWIVFLADIFAGDDFSSLLYSDEYISLLKDIKEGKIMYDNV